MSQNNQNTQQENTDQPSGNDQQESNDQQQSSPSRSAAEWIVFAVSALIVAAVVAVIGSDALDTRRPPAFTTTVASTTQRDGAHYLTVDVENTGDTTASDVKVGAQLRQDGRTVEQATQMINFLAGQETRQLTFVFDHDPREAQVQTGVSAFQAP